MESQTALQSPTAPPITPQKLVYSDLEAAPFLDLSVHTLRKMRVKGTGPAYIKMGKSCKYRLADLKAYIEKSVVAR